ncbi:hypothetical protein [Brevibacillus borstelensis]|uniref:hypothetical protein n=1 Tax=Brevibacillus borstelensis TaxID=45462 RepID=UPI003D1CE134
MKKLGIVVISIVLLLLTGCGRQSSPEQVQGLGKAEAAAIAQAAVKKFFQAEVDIEDREVTLEDPDSLIDSDTHQPIYRGVPVHAVLKRKPQDGEIAAFHAVIDPKTKQILSLSINRMNKQTTQTTSLSTEELERIAADYVRSRALLSPQAVKLVKSSPVSTGDRKQYFYFTDDQHTVAVGVDTDSRQIVTFTFD